jgi:hypothetical protein
VTLDELNRLLRTAAWFNHLGEPFGAIGCVSIDTLAPWAGEPTGDDTLEQIADDMSWLPTSRDEDDPIHGNSLEEAAEALGTKRDVARQSLEIYKTTLTALRRFDGHAVLKVGPHDFAEAARGAALFAARRAAYEVLLGKPGLWCRLMAFYHAGHWPCGLLPDGRIVVL